MNVIPSIDLLRGKCVRLVRGNRESALYYEETAFEIAERYANEGARRMHVIDLDGAFQGEMKNKEIIKELAKSYSLQVGGGIRSEKTIDSLLAQGVEKVVLSTLLLKDEKTSRDIKKRYRGKVIGSFDFKDGKIAYEGWLKKSDKDFRSVKNNLDEIIVTDVLRDGTFTGPNIELLKKVRGQFEGKLSCAGGIRDVFDLLELKKARIDGAIVGRAFLEKKILLKDGFFIGRLE